MDFDFSAEQYALRDEARRFLDEQCPPSHVREFIDEPGAWSRDLWKRMADLGWMALPFPEKFGGLGRSSLDLTLLLGELGRVLAPVPFLSSVAFAGQIINLHGTDEQRARWLPGIASGERIGTIAIAEANGAYEATFDAKGGRITGEKHFVPDASAADLFVVGLQSGWYVVEENARVTLQKAFDRTRGLGYVTFDDAPGELLEGVPGLELGIRHSVASICAESIGVAQKVLDMSVQYAKDREQFGRPIGSFQAIKHKLAEMATELEASRAAAFYASWAVATGAEDAQLASHIAKSYCSDALAHLGGEGVQVHGGIAFTWEHDMHLYLKRLKSNQVRLGDAAIHREKIARLVGL